VRLFIILILALFATQASASKSQVDCGKFHYDDEELITTDNAIAACTAAIAENVNDSRAYATRANAYLKKNNLDAALADFDKYIALKPNDSNGYDGRAEVFHRKGNLDKAIADISRSILLADAEAKQIDPTDKGFPLGYSERAKLYEEKGDREHAIADYKKVLEIDPIDKESFNKLKSFGVKIIKSPSGWGMEVYKEPEFQ
jgi:tetratricopeptide (TPR) repeat protein